MVEEGDDERDEEETAKSEPKHLQASLFRLASSSRQPAERAYDSPAAVALQHAWHEDHGDRADCGGDERRGAASAALCVRELSVSAACVCVRRWHEVVGRTRCSVQPQLWTSSCARECGAKRPPQP